jgi:hypothetical protein
LLAGQLLARAQQRSELLDRASSGTKLALICPQATKSAIHVASFTSVLRPGTILDVRRIGHDQLECAVAQDVPHRLPVDPGRLHRHMGAARRRQPAQQRFNGRLSMSRRSDTRDGSFPPT